MAKVLFLAIFNFLLCLPIGNLLAALIRHSLEKSKKHLPSLDSSTAELAILAFIFVITAFVVKSPILDFAFYHQIKDERVGVILDFAREHRDGRYLVEVPDQKFPAAQLDARAMNSYLGVQGNETASVVFREASPNSLFFNPLVNNFSAHPDAYGIIPI